MSPGTRWARLLSIIQTHVTCLLSKEDIVENGNDYNTNISARVYVYVCVCVHTIIDRFELWQQRDLENPLHTHTLARSHL